MKNNELIKNFIKDLRVELMDEFDRNFQRKAFFNQSWPKGKMPNSRGSMMMRSGALRKGQRATISGNSIHFTNSQPYASIHNEGGTITVTAQMKKFFWAMYYKTSGEAGKYKRGAKKMALSEEAEWWYRLALKRIGSQIHIDQRQFVGWHPEVNRSIETLFNEHFKELEVYIKQKLKRK